MLPKNVGSINAYYWWALLHECAYQLLNAFEGKN